MKNMTILLLMSLVLPAWAQTTDYSKMDPSQLPVGTKIIPANASQNGQLLPCRIEEQNRSLSYDKKDAYVSRVKVRTESPLASGSKVQLTVRRQVEAYNGLQMQKDYQQEFTVVREVYAIGTDSIVEVPRGGERTVIVHAFPAQAATGMKVTAKSMIGTIAMVTEEATFDANGEARLTVTGKVGGQTALLLTLENSKVAAQSVIQVDDPSLLPVYAPTASHISGTFVAKGEAVTLHIRCLRPCGHRACRPSVGHCRLLLFAGRCEAEPPQEGREQCEEERWNHRKGVNEIRI